MWSRFLKFTLGYNSNGILMHFAGLIRWLSSNVKRAIFSCNLQFHKRLYLCYLFIIIILGFVLLERSPHNFIREFYPDGFDALSICKQHEYLLGVDREHHIVKALKAVDGKEVAILGKVLVAGDDNEHFKNPSGILCDEQRSRILVSDTGNKRIQVFSISDFSFLKSVKTVEHYSVLALDYENNRIFSILLETPDDRIGSKIRILDAEKLQIQGNPLDVSFSDGSSYERKMFAVDLAVDAKQKKLLVLDFGNARYDIFSLDDLRFEGVRGVPSGFYDYGLPARHPNRPMGIAVDDITGHIAVSDDADMHRIQLFSSRKVESLTNKYLFAPERLAFFKGKLFVTDRDPKTGQKRLNLFGEYN